MTRIEKLIKVAVHGAPRSGTSWLGEIFNSSPGTAYRYQPLFSYAHKNFLDESSSRADIEEFFHRLARCEDQFTHQIQRRNAGELPSFAKSALTHLIYKEVRYHHILDNMMQQADDLMLCAVVRNPLAVINSWLRAPREFRGDLGWSELEEWRFAGKKNNGRPEEYNGYEKWKEAARLFLSLREAYPERVYLLHYSKLLDEPVAQTGKLFDFFKLPVTEATLDFLEQSRNRDYPSAYSVFRSRPDDSAWKTELNQRIARQIVEDLEGTELEIFLGDDIAHGGVEAFASKPGTTTSSSG